MDIYIHTWPCGSKALRMRVGASSHRAAKINVHVAIKINGHRAARERANENGFRAARKRT